MTLKCTLTMGVTQENTTLFFEKTVELPFLPHTGLVLCDVDGEELTVCDVSYLLDETRCIVGIKHQLLDSDAELDFAEQAYVRAGWRRFYT